MKKFILGLLVLSMVFASVFPVCAAEVIAGDVDGNSSVNAKDAVSLRRYVTGGWSISVNETLADVDANYIVNAVDAVRIRRYVVGGWNIELKIPEKVKQGIIQKL